MPILKWISVDPPTWKPMPHSIRGSTLPLGLEYSPLIGCNLCQTSLNLVQALSMDSDYPKSVAWGSLYPKQHADWCCQGSPYSLISQGFQMHFLLASKALGKVTPTVPVQWKCLRLPVLSSKQTRPHIWWLCAYLLPPIWIISSSPANIQLSPPRPARALSSMKS